MNTWRKKEDKGATDKGRYRQLKKNYLNSKSKTEEKERVTGLHEEGRRLSACWEEGKRLVLRWWPSLGSPGCLGQDGGLCVPSSTQE